MTKTMKTTRSSIGTWMAATRGSYWFVINAPTFGIARAYGLIFDKLARVDEQTRAQAALPFTIMDAPVNS